MHILVLGATSPSGQAFVETALAAGHTLTIHARTPTKLPLAIQSHEKVEVIKGTLDDIPSLLAAPFGRIRPYE